MAWYFYIGLIATVCIAIFTIPQLVQVIKTKDTSGLSVMMLTLLVVGDFCFGLNGLGLLVDKSAPVIQRISGGLPLLLGNIIACSISAVLLVLKIRAMHWAKVFKTTEKQFCENYETYKAKIRMHRAERDAARQVDVPKDIPMPSDASLDEGK